MSNLVVDLWIFLIEDRFFLGKMYKMKIKKLIHQLGVGVSAKSKFIGGAAG